MARLIGMLEGTKRGGIGSWALVGVALGLISCLTPAPLAAAPTSKKSKSTKAEAKEVGNVVNAFEASDNPGFLAACGLLASKLRQSGPESKELASQLLTQRKVFVTEPATVRLINAARRSNPAVAAQFLLEIARARSTVRATGRGHVMVGRVMVEGGKTEAEMVLAQMLIFPGGYFAAEVGDLDRPICFRAQGYQPLDVSLAGKKDDVIGVGEVRIKVLPKEEGAALRGTVALDGEGSRGAAKVQIRLLAGPTNTPNNTSSGRPRWPAPLVAEVNEKGEFVADGLTPGDYYIQITADKHADSTQHVSLKPSEQHELSSCRLLSNDVGHYVGKPAPQTKEIAWEKDFAAAIKRAKEEKKPLMVMMTATWCGYCKMLESQTLNDPWVRYFLSSFVLVKAYEDKEVEGKYGPNGYPTLVFADSEGKLAYKSFGFKPTVAFCAECARAFDALHLKLPDELQTLIDKEVISVRSPALSKN